MMAISIGRVLIEKFRLFDRLSVNFDTAKFIVFDGPNGYGKTSFYDAIELFFTGKIRRYNEWERIVTDGREIFKEHPYLYYFGKYGDLIIKLELEIDGKKTILMRKGKREELQTKTRISELKFEMYELKSFDASEGVLIKNEEEYLTKLLGKNYSENFQFLHYVEQEENISLLKNKDRERRNAIDYLFNTMDFQLKLEKIKNATSKVGELCGKQEESRLQNINKEIADLKKAISGEIKEVKHIRLITWTTFDWDEQQVDFKDGRFADLMGEDGILERLKQLVLNIDEFTKKKENENIDKIIEKKELLRQLLLYYKYLDVANEYEEKLIKQQEIERIQKELSKGILKAILGKKIELDSLLTLLSGKIDIKSYMDSQKAILKLHENMTVFSEAAASLKDSRASFTRSFHLYEQVSGDKKECPMCGFEWKTSEELKEKLREQEEKLDRLTKESGKDLDSTLKIFERVFVNPIQDIFQSYINTNRVNDGFVRELQRAAKNKNAIKMLYEEIESKDIRPENFMVDDIDETIDKNMASLKKEIEDKKQHIDEKRIQPYFADIYLKYFSQKEDNVRKITSETVEKKKEYLKWKYSVYQSTALKDKQSDYDKKLTQYNNAKTLKDRLSDLKDIYEDSLRSYQKGIIGDIEILFHIYSGRISQDCQGGMGLFILEKNGIRFLEDPGKTHDAIFTMSSGQLAVLIIAFTLTLNKKYSQNKMLFVDDPVQTLDELNVSSLVELLRNEFSDRQIFLSTHEDKMSAYMRYKFEKYGLKTERLSFKDQYLRV